MAQIEVNAIDDQVFEVIVVAQSTTTHRVTVDIDYAKQLTQGKISTQSLLQKSFAFLLEREANTSILRNFDLGVISRYFPEYESAISQ